MSRSLALLASLLLSSAASADLSGTALIVDGDTITISGNKIRLNGIDTPEPLKLWLRFPKL